MIYFFICFFHMKMTIPHIKHIISSLIKFFILFISIFSSFSLDFNQSSGFYLYIACDISLINYFKTNYYNKYIISFLIKFVNFSS